MILLGWFSLTHTTCQCFYSRYLAVFNGVLDSLPGLSPVFVLEPVLFTSLVLLLLPVFSFISLAIMLSKSSLASFAVIIGMFNLFAMFGILVCRYVVPDTLFASSRQSISACFLGIKFRFIFLQTTLSTLLHGLSKKITLPATSQKCHQLDSQKRYMQIILFFFRDIQLVTRILYHKCYY